MSSKNNLEVPERIRYWVHTLYEYDPVTGKTSVIVTNTKFENTVEYTPKKQEEKKEVKVNNSLVI